MRKLKITLDLDGVIHSYSSGWKGHDQLPDASVVGMIPWIQAQLALGHEITIFSMRNAANDYLLDLQSQVDKFLDDSHGDRNPPAVAVVKVDIKSIAEAQEAIRDWLRAEGMTKQEVSKIKFAVGKPHFDIYIDDRAFRFEGNPYHLPQHMDFKFCKPWWKK